MTATTTAGRTVIRANGLDFDALTAGPEDGELVLLLHGFPQPASCWSRQLTALANAGYRVVAPNQRGYSPRARPRDTSSYSIDNLVRDALAFVGDDRFHVVGHDWGGAIGWALASNHPDRVRSLTVVSTPHPRAMLDALPRGQVLRSLYIGFFQLPRVPELMLSAGNGWVFERMLTRSGLSADEVAETVEHMQGPGALRAALNWYRANARSPLNIGRVTVPTLYVWSTKDPALGRAAAEATRKYVTGPYRFEVLEGVSHWVMDEASEDLNRLLLAHLGAV